MADPKPKTFHYVGRDNEDADIQAYAPVGIRGTPKLIIFARSRIDFLFDGDSEGTSGIRLISGVDIQVGVNLQELHRLLHEGDLRTGNIIDLATVTGRQPAKLEIGEAVS